MIVEFPRTAGYWRRQKSRQPRQSKNGSPEQRAAMKPAADPERPRQQRRSQNGTPEQRAAKKLLAPVVELAPRRAKKAVKVAHMTHAEFAATVSRFDPDQLREVNRVVREMQRGERPCCQSELSAAVKVIEQADNERPPAA
jgi:hypothetical protein